MFHEPTPPDITESIPGRIASARVAASYQQTGAVLDISVDEMPFLLAVSTERPYQRASAEISKQQIDTSPSSGEQTFSQWWTRAQDSWHKGAGVTWYEPTVDEGTKYRYHASMGVDVWTVGEASLLHRLDKVVDDAAGVATSATSAVVGGVDCAFLTVGTSVQRWPAGVTYSASGGTPASRVAVAGAKILVGTTAGILAGDATGSSLSALWTATAGSVVTPYWVKARIMAARDNSLYELTLAGGALPAPFYTHPDTNWTWTSIIETPACIMAAGYSNGYGRIYAIGLDSSGSGSPILKQPVEVTTFPPGEEIHSLMCYLGTTVIMGTSKGVRIGVTDNNEFIGTIQYGPLTVKTTKPVRAITARDSFVFAGVEGDLDGSSGLVRIDLSAENTDGRYAYAYDLNTHDIGAVRAVCAYGLSNRMIVAVAGKGIYVESATNYEATGYLDTGRIRYATSEPKRFDRMKIRADLGGDSSVGIYTIDSFGVSLFNFSIAAAFNTDSDITLQGLNAAQPHISLKLVLAASTDGTATPRLQSLSVKALPRVSVPRIIKIPLMCFDREKDRHGVTVGYQGSAFARVAALEAIESDRATVFVKDFTTGEGLTAQIKSIEFTRTAYPEGPDGNFGGILALTLLTT